MHTELGIVFHTHMVLPCMRGLSNKIIAYLLWFNRRRLSVLYIIIPNNYKQGHWSACIISWEFCWCHSNRIYLNFISLGNLPHWLFQYSEIIFNYPSLHVPSYFPLLSEYQPILWSINWRNWTTKLTSNLNYFSRYPFCQVLYQYVFFQNIVRWIAERSLL